MGERGSTDAMGESVSTSTKSSAFVRSAVVVVGGVAVTTIVLLPFALSRTGSGGLVGLAIAGSICLFAALLSEWLMSMVAGESMPLAALALGMGARMAPPLVACCYLALQPGSGRDHLAFVGYLLAFYLVTLALESWLAVRRLPKPRSVDTSC